MFLGICLEKGGFRAVWLDGTKSIPRLVDRERCTNPDIGDPVLSANWYSGRFEQIFARYPILCAASKISFDLKTLEAVENHGAPLGLLGLRAHLDGVPLKLLSKIKLKGHKTFNLPKGTDTSAWIDALRDTKPRWDAATRDAALAAASCLP